MHFSACPRHKSLSTNHTNPTNAPTQLSRMDHLDRPPAGRIHKAPRPPRLGPFVSFVWFVGNILLTPRRPTRPGRTCPRTTRTTQTGLDASRADDLPTGQRPVSLKPQPRGKLSRPCGPCGPWTKILRSRRQNDARRLITTLNCLLPQHLGPSKRNTIQDSITPCPKPRRHVPKPRHPAKIAAISSAPSTRQVPAARSSGSARPPTRSRCSAVT